MTDPLKCRCPTCGHPVLPNDPLAILQPVQRAVFDVIYQSGQVGITRQSILDRVWNGRERTPESQSVISVVIGGVNKRIVLLDMRIVGEGRPRHYRVISTHDRRDRYAPRMRAESAARRTVHNGAKA